MLTQAERKSNKPVKGSSNRWYSQREAETETDRGTQIEKRREIILEIPDRRAHTHTHSHTFREKKSQTCRDKYIHGENRQRQTQQTKRKRDGQIRVPDSMRL